MPTAQSQAYYTILLAQFNVAILRSNRTNTPLFRYQSRFGNIILRKFTRFRLRDRTKCGKKALSLSFKLKL
ncbi:hypothetical protein ES703_93206 [subsurface metagenome]